MITTGAFNWLIGSGLETKSWHPIWISLWCSMLHAMYFSLTFILCPTLHQLTVGTQRDHLTSLQALGHMAGNIWGGYTYLPRAFQIVILKINRPFWLIDSVWEVGVQPILKKITFYESSDYWLLIPEEDMAERCVVLYLCQQIFKGQFNLTRK